MSLTLEDVEALVMASALPKDELWDLLESRTELEYEEFEQMWQKREERAVVQ